VYSNLLGYLQGSGVTAWVSLYHWCILGLALLVFGFLTIICGAHYLTLVSIMGVVTITFHIVTSKDVL